MQEGAIGADESAAFVSSIATVLGGMQADGRRVQDGELSWEAFVDRYGHLRPGTYDITSPCYRSAPEAYLRPIVERAGEADAPAWPGWAPATRDAIGAALARADLPADVDAFESFVRGAIAGREEGKFVFTRALSDALECIAEFGGAHGPDARRPRARRDRRPARVPRRDERHRRLPRAPRAGEGRELFHVAQGVCLPGQIATDADLVCFEQQAAEPNFVTQRAVEAPVVAFDLGPAPRRSTARSC